MATVSTKLWGWLADRSPVLFLLAGVSILVATTNDALGAFTPLTTQEGACW
jgi:hypothetical protein